MKKSQQKPIKRIVTFLLFLFWTYPFLFLQSGYVPFLRSPDFFFAEAQSSEVSKASPPNAGDYACILQDAYFYSFPDEKRGIFLLPKTYYVKILEYQTDYCKIEYLYDASDTRKLIGYAKTDQLTFVDYVPNRPYLYYVFELEYTIESPQIEDSSFLTTIKVSCAYYGDFKIGSKTYCYVLREETFGYVPKPDTLSFEENTEYADRLTETLPPDSSSIDQKKPNGASSMQIALLITLCLLVPVLASMIVKPPKRPPYESDD